MAEFSYLKSAVYIFENSKAQRVKVGTTVMATSNVITRLQDVNDIWLGKKITCQICGGRRLISRFGFVPRHVVSGNSCPGGFRKPLEKDVTFAEAHLKNIKSCKGLDTRIINTLEKRIKKFRNYNHPLGEWQHSVIYYTDHAEAVEKLSHRILEKHLDELAPLGEVFCCSVSVAAEAVETALKQLGLLDSVKRSTL